MPHRSASVANDRGLEREVLTRAQPSRRRSIFAVRQESLHAFACRLSCHDQTRWLIVPLGLRLAVDSVTNRPVDAERCTVVELLVPDPTRSVVVFPGQRAAAALEKIAAIVRERTAAGPSTPLSEVAERLGMDFPEL